MVFKSPRSMGAGAPLLSTVVILTVLGHYYKALPACAPLYCRHNGYGSSEAVMWKALVWGKCVRYCRQSYISSRRSPSVPQETILVATAMEDL
ncbi:hypothetical protein V8E53_013898 [Lactarius tabidus]